MFSAPRLLMPSSPLDTPQPVLLPVEARHWSIELSAAGGAIAESVDLVPCPPDLAGATPTRIHHYRAGRLCAQRALQELLGNRAVPDVSRGPAGAPMWPPGVVGSITHTEDFASAAVAHAIDIAALGIDVERVMGDKVSRQVTPGVAWACEVLDGRRAGLTRLEALTLVFSAKESVFKCLYPRVGRFFDFHDVRLEEVHSDIGTFTVRLVKSLSGDLRAGTLLAGRFAFECGRVHTAVILRSFPKLSA